MNRLQLVQRCLIWGFQTWLDRRKWGLAGRKHFLSLVRLSRRLSHRRRSRKLRHRRRRLMIRTETSLSLHRRRIPRLAALRTSSNLRRSIPWVQPLATLQKHSKLREAKKMTIERTMKHHLLRQESPIGRKWIPAYLRKQTLASKPVGTIQKYWWPVPADPSMSRKCWSPQQVPQVDFRKCSNFEFHQRFRSLRRTEKQRLLLAKLKSARTQTGRALRGFRTARLVARSLTACWHHHPSSCFRRATALV